MNAVQLKQQLITFTELLFHEMFLDEQFNQLQQLQDENKPNFMMEVVSLLFEDSERLLNELAKALDQQNVGFKKVDARAHQLKGSSSSIGALRVQIVSIIFCIYCKEKNVEGCLKCLQLVKHEYALVMNKLEALFNSTPDPSFSFVAGPADLSSWWAAVI